MAVEAAAMKPSVASSLHGRHACCGGSWLHVSFRVSDKGCCELGAAVVVKDASDSGNAHQSMHEQAKPVFCAAGTKAEPQSQAACMHEDAQLRSGSEELSAHREQAASQVGCKSVYGRVLGFVTTAFKPEMHGMSGGRACIRFRAAELSSQILNSLHIVNPYAPGTLRMVHVTECRGMV